MSRRNQLSIVYLFQDSKRRAMSNYHTLGIPIVPSPTSSLPAPPFTSLSSNGSGHASSTAPTAANGAQHHAAAATTGLNGAISLGNNGSQPRSSDGESDHEYYNDVDRLKRELQPLHQPRNETTV